MSEKSAIRDRAIEYFKQEFPQLGFGALDEQMIPAAKAQPLGHAARLEKRASQEEERGR